LKKINIDILIIAAGIILLLLASPIFIFTSIFPTINSQIGQHQISSWLALALGFVGFILIIYGAARHNI
jgi:uncharacterized membrane protein YidH (DUF202 family)